MSPRSTATSSQPSGTPSEPVHPSAESEAAAMHTASPTPGAGAVPVPVAGVDSVASTPNAPESGDVSMGVLAANQPGMPAPAATSGLTPPVPTPAASAAGPDDLTGQALGDVGSVPVPPVVATPVAPPTSEPTPPVEPNNLIAAALARANTVDLVVPTTTPTAPEQPKPAVESAVEPSSVADMEPHDST